MGLLFGAWSQTAYLMMGLYIGREITQAEYRWIFEYGERKRANLPLLGWADSRVWNRKSLIDFLAPILVCALTAYVGNLLT